MDAILVFSPNGTYTTKTTLEAARTAADAVGKTIVVTSALTQAQSNISGAWPTDRGLEIRFGGSVLNSTAFTFTDGRVFTAWQGYVFKGAGAITGLPYVRPEWFGPTASAGINEAIATGGVVRLLAKTYTITTSIVVANTTKIIGEGVGKSIISHTYSAPTPYAITDATTQAASISGVVLQGFTLSGDSFSQAADTRGINLKNVNDTLIQDVQIGGFSYFGLRICSAVDQIVGTGKGARNNKAVRVIVDGIRAGDAFQHSGYDTEYVSCTARNYGDTGFAVGPDSFGVGATGLAIGSTYVDCIADGQTSGTTANQIGFAWGPYVPGFRADIRMTNCTTRNCNIALWGVTFDGLTITDCFFYDSASTNTGNVRLDGVRYFSITGGLIRGCKTTGTGDASALLLNSARFSYGASDFDSSTTYGFIGGGIRIDSNDVPGIIVTVGATVSTPTFKPTSNNIIFSDINFGGAATSIAYMPLVNDADMILNHQITRCTKSSGAWISANGGDSVYSGILFKDNMLGASVTAQTVSVSQFGILYDFGILFGIGTPYATVTPRCFRDNYMDVSTGNFWKAGGTNDVSWKQLTN